MGHPKDACQGFGILPKQFPLPLRLCELPPTEIQNKTTTQNVPGLNKEQNERKRPADRPVHIPEKTNKMAKTRTEEMNPSGNVGINVTASLNDDENKSYIYEKMNKVIKPYSYVFNITARKQIKVPKVKLRFRKDMNIIP